MSAVVFSDAPPVSPATADRPRLTPRETEILDLIADGLTNPLIAERLWISAFTVKTMQASIAGKLGIGDRAGMVARAYQAGILAGPVPAPDGRGVLSLVEFRVLTLITQGATDEQIAIEFGVTLDAAKRHVAGLRRTLDARNRAHTIRRAIDLGALTLVPKGGAQ